VDIPDLYRTIHKLKSYALLGLLKLTTKNTGTYILDEEWDHLIILDNLRFDVFRDEYIKRNLPGKLEYRISRGMWTGQFLMENFSKIDGSLDDIIYISANPFTDVYLPSTKFFKLISVWKYEWNEQYKSVLPHSVTKYTIRMAEKYPDKRLVIHFLQPHQPYLFLIKRKEIQDNAISNIRTAVSSRKKIKFEIEKEPLGKLYLSTIYKHYELPLLIKSYIENLHIVLPYVEYLLYKLQGRVVVTSDHGEIFGKPVSRLLPLKVYGHGIGRISDLIVVPWLIFDQEDKVSLRDITEIKKEIIKIEKMLGIRQIRGENEKLKLKDAISRLKLKGKI